MPQLTFPITKLGLCVDVKVNHDATTLQGLQAAGQSLPNSIQAKALIDTGADVSAVAPAILRQLAIPVHSHRTTVGIGGSVPVRLFNAAFFIFDARQHHLPWFIQPDLLVMELPTGLPVDVLIGLDVLLTCKLVVDGPAGQFTLEF
jgi:hypothetical protein